MIFAALAPIVAALAVVFTLSASAQLAGRRIEICQNGTGEDELWDKVGVFGPDETGKLQAALARSLIGGCQIINNTLWTATVEVEYARSKSANLTEVTHVQKCVIPPTPVDQPVRCDPEVRPLEVRKGLNGSAVVPPS